MKRRMTKALCVALSFVLFATCLAGCVPEDLFETLFSQSASSESTPTQLVEGMVKAPGEPDYITRAEWIERLVSAAMEDGYDPARAASLAPFFDDVDAGHAQYAFVQTAAMMEWLNADVAQGGFEPDAPATRAFVATTAVLAAGYLLVDGQDEPSEEILQSDDPLSLLYARRLGVISEDAGGSLRAEEAADDALCESALAWYAGVDNWDDEDYTPVAELNPGVSNLTKTGLTYTIDAEGLLHLPADFGEEPAVGDVLLLPATEDAPEGIAAKISGGTPADGFTYEDPILADVFARVDLRYAQDVDLSGEALFASSSTGAGLGDAGGATDAAAAGEGPGALSEPETIALTSDPEGAGAGAEWLEGSKSYTDCFTLPVASGKASLLVNEISIKYGIQFGKFDIAPTDWVTWEMDLPLAVRCRFTFDLMLIYETEDIAATVMSLINPFRPVAVDLELDEEQEKELGEDLELIELIPGISVDGSWEGKGAIGIPMGGSADFAFGDGEMRAEQKLKDIDVKYRGELSGEVSVTCGVSLKILNFTVIEDTYTMKLIATQTVQQDDYGFCANINVVFQDEFKADTFSKVVGLLGSEVLILIIDTALSITYDDGVGTWARDKLRAFRDMLVNGMGFGGPRPAQEIARWHWEGADMASARRTPNDICTRDFELVVVSPTALEVDERAPLSIVARPKPGKGHAGITGWVRAESLTPDILSYTGPTATGVSDGMGKVQMVWVFQDETGEWDSLLKGEGKIPVGEPVEQTLSVILESYHNHTGTCGATLYLTGTAAESGTLQYTLVRTASYGDGTEPAKHVTTYGEGTHIEAGVNFTHTFICDSTVSDGDSDCRWDYTCIFVPDDPNSPTIDLHT